MWMQEVAPVFAGTSLFPEIRMQKCRTTGKVFSVTPSDPVKFQSKCLACLEFQLGHFGQAANMSQARFFISEVARTVPSPRAVPTVLRMEDGVSVGCKHDRDAALWGHQWERIQTGAAARCL